MADKTRGVGWRSNRLAWQRPGKGSSPYMVHLTVQVGVAETPNANPVAGMAWEESSYTIRPRTFKPGAAAQGDNVLDQADRRALPSRVGWSDLVGV